MRIVGGKAKGKMLKVPHLAYERRVRPLTESTREALFNILQPIIEGKDFLDLFAGTGAVGIEALSRGARLAIFAESDKRVVQTLRENIRNTGFEDRAEVFGIDVARAIKLLSRQSAKFHFIFIGAPYASSLAEETLTGLSDGSLLYADGIVIAEYSKRTPLKDQYGMLSSVREKEYGETTLSFYKVRLPSLPV